MIWNPTHESKALGLFVSTSMYLLALEPFLDGKDFCQNVGCGGLHALGVEDCVHWVCVFYFGNIFSL
jgi:hypothetical protein